MQGKRNSVQTWGIVLILALGQSIFPLVASAQKTEADQDVAASYKKGVELFSRKKFTSAQHEFNKAKDEIPSKTSILWETARLYEAVSAVELFNADGEPLLGTWVEDHPEHPEMVLADLNLGRYHFRKKKYSKAIKHLEKVDPHEISEADLEEFYFKRGYAYFLKEKYDLAKNDLSQISETENRYQSPAKYYMSYIFYREGAHEKAMEGFRSLEKDKLFGPIVPYYICQIHFLQDQYEEVITYGTDLLEVAADSKRGEVARMVGQSHYELKQYDKAVPMLELALADLGGTDEQRYQLGYCFYQAGNCDDANRMFEPVTRTRTEMAQLAYYHMADCYLKADQKRQARGAFREASRMRFDEQITEDALFNFAKISYELSYDPYNEAIEAFEEYIDEHPNSPRVDEAYAFLLQVYLTTKNFGKALTSLDRIKDKDEVLKKTYQKVAYMRGIELFNDQDYKNSVIQLRKVKKYPVDNRMLAMAQYWQSEAYARLGKNEAAEIGFVRFLEMPGAISSEEYELALYALGYTHFERKQYPKAIEYFRKFAGAAKNQDKRLNDAYLRIGDGYYLTRNTQRAIDFYDKAVQIGNFDTDYGIFQISVCYGLSGQNASKIQSLKSMLANYPSSSFAADAKYEIGETHFFMDRNDEAKKYFNMVLNDHQHSSYVGKAKLNLGLIAYNSSDDAKAMPLFKDVAENYPATSEAKEALFKIQKIYTEQGKVEDFEAYVSTQQFPDITQGALDTSYYQAGEFMYTRSQYAKALTEFEKYLDKFPNGYFLLNANFYLAESAVVLKQEDRALTAYNEVLKYQKNTFTEKAIITAASIYFKRENYQEALLRYAMLEEVAEIAENLTEAQIGLMRCNYRLNKFAECESYCEKLLKSERTDESTRLEASITLARSAMAQNNHDLALTRFTETAGLATNEIAAESMFNVAKVYFLKGNYEQVETEVFNLMDRLPGYHKWVSEGFLLLADSYVERNDAFQARLTLQNIIDNYDDPDVTQRARQKLMLLQREQEIDRIIHPSEDLLIEFETQRLKDSLLFELEYLDLEIEQIEETTPDQK